MSSLHLLPYLNDTFPVSGKWTNDELINHFMEQFGVGVKIEPHIDGKFLFLFKYDQLAVKWLHKLTHESRGIIVRNSDDGWEIMSHPFSKFFNSHEGHCPIFNPEAFSAECSNLAFAEKADGSCLAVWFDKYQNIWRVSTLGSITTLPLHGGEATFDDLFRRVVTEDIFNHLIPGRTYIFELCAKLNRVVTRYPKDIVYLLGIRDASGKLMDRTMLENEYNHFLKDVPNLILPQFAHFTDLNIKTHDDAQKYVESKTNDISLGEYPEGFVITKNGIPIAKMKNANYLVLHHSLSDAACTRKAVIAAFFQGNMDDLYPALPEEFQKAADKLKDWLASFKVYFNSEIANIFKSQSFPTRKDYALCVQSLPERAKMFQAFFFFSQQNVCDQNRNLGDDFSDWIQKSWEKYEDYWKKVCYDI